MTHCTPVYLTELIIRYVIGAFLLVLLAFGAHSPRARMPFVAAMPFFISATAALGIYFSDGEDSALWMRSTALVVEAPFVATLIAALLKLPLSAWFAGTVALVFSLALFAFADLASDHHHFQTAALVIGGVVLILAALCYVFVRTKRSVINTVVFFVAAAMYIVALGLIVYGPNVRNELGLDERAIAWALTTGVPYIIFALAGIFLYVPADPESLANAHASKRHHHDTNACSDGRRMEVVHSDVFDAFQYILLTGRFAPEHTEKPE